MANQDTPESTLGTDTDEKQTTTDPSPEADQEEEPRESSPESEPPTDPKTDSDYARRMGFAPPPESESEPDPEPKPAPEPESKRDTTPESQASPSHPPNDPEPPREERDERQEEIEMSSMREKNPDESDPEADSRTDGGSDTSGDSGGGGGGSDIIFDDADVQKWGFIAFIGFEAICATLIVFTTYLIFTHGVHHIPWWMLVGVGVLIIAFLAAAFGGLAAAKSMLNVAGAFASNSKSQDSEHR